MDSGRRAGLCAVLAWATILVVGCAVSAGPPSPAVVDVVVSTDPAAGLRFVPDEVGAPAGSAVRLTFRNVSTEAHNLTFDAPISGGTRTIVEATGSDAIDFVTPAPGRYRFVCTIHMGMSGTLTVN